MLYRYRVMEGGYNYDEELADVLFATSDQAEAVEAAQDFGQGATVIMIDEDGQRKRVFTAHYDVDLSIEE